MSKQLGDYTLYELKQMCEAKEDCENCQFNDYDEEMEVHYCAVKMTVDHIPCVWTDEDLAREVKEDG